MLSKTEFESRQAQLDAEMKAIWGDNVFLDGITDYGQYSKSEHKILWILKEVHRDTGFSGGRNWRDFLKNFSGSSLTTYGNVMRVSFGIFYDVMHYDKSYFKIDRASGCIGTDQLPVLDDIALININKSGGGSVSSPKSLANEYNRPEVKDFLLKQIEFINPNIIINTHGVDQFFEDQVQGHEITKINGERFAHTGKRLIISTSHPNRAPTESYCNNIFNVILNQ
jgi:hypothetical protein